MPAEMLQKKNDRSKHPRSKATLAKIVEVLRQQLPDADTSQIRLEGDTVGGTLVSNRFEGLTVLQRAALIQEISDALQRGVPNARLGYVVGFSPREATNR